MSETTEDVRIGADPVCPICDGAGWHWGWKRGAYWYGVPWGTDPVMLRCPCVDVARAARARLKAATPPAEGGDG